MAGVIDLTQLPAPNLVEVLDFETIVSEIKADAIGRANARSPDLGAQLANTLALETEPMTILLEACAYRETLVRSSFNQRARASLLAYAVGDDLVNVAANLAVAKEPGESDDAFRSRALLGPDGWSTAGPYAAYVYHALSADPAVADVLPSSPSPGVVKVVVLSKDADGVADATVLANVSAALNDDTVRPLTDQVNVVSAAVIPYDVTAVLKFAAGPDASLVQAAAEAAVQAYAARQRKLNQPIRRNALIGALMQPGASDVTLTTPAADIPASDTAANVLRTLTVTTEADDV